MEHCLHERIPGLSTHFHSSSSHTDVLSCALSFLIQCVRYPLLQWHTKPLAPNFADILIMFGQNNWGPGWGPCVWPPSLLTFLRFEKYNDVIICSSTLILTASYCRYGKSLCFFAWCWKVMHQDGPRARKNVGNQIHTMLLVWRDHTEQQWNRNTLMQQKSILQVLYKEGDAWNAFKRDEWWVLVKKKGNPNSTFLSSTRKNNRFPLSMY